MKKLILTVFLTLIFISPALSEELDDTCDDPGTDQEIIHCLAAEYEEVDGQLNSVYQELISEAKEEDARDEMSSYAEISAEDKYENRLREAQRAWIVYRDCECAFVSAPAARGGRMSKWGKMLEYYCLIEVTQARVATIQNRLGVWPGGY